MNELPIARGLFLCEKVIVEEGTHFVSLVNCFARKKFASFPSAPMDFVMFAILLNGRGSVRLDTVVENTETLVEIDRQSVVFKFPHPLSQLRFSKRYYAVSFPEPGDYEFQLLADGEIVVSTILRLRIQEEPS